ncbi:hypothetical protein ACH4S9_37255 [Streptomyces sp. NPDC021225]|uniref:hypothetical protein n=1 Tax=Streptomyces sp. NPDC021225 TaxID=3365121 RepID=UPI0037960AE0
MQADRPPGAALSTPRAAGVVGVISALLLATVILLFRDAVPTESTDPAVWFADSSRRDELRAAVRLLPFGGIFFLWFIGAVRAYIGPSEDKFFSTIFLGGGFLFAAVLFLLAGTAFGVITVADNPHATALFPLWEHDRQTILGLISSYATRLAAVFTMSTTMIGQHLGIFPRWLVLLGYLVFLGLIFVVGITTWIVLAFPLWILVVSGHILVINFRPPHLEGPTK